MHKLWCWFKRLFTHAYGTCATEGCDEPAERWIGLCDQHWGDQIRRAAHEQNEREFNYRAEIVAEGVRRALKGEKA